MDKSKQILEEENAMLIQSLQEIAECKGRYNQDRLIHACNTIEDMAALAKEAIEKTNNNKIEQ